MTVTCVHIYVKKEYITDFISASAENHKHSIREKGNIRFDVLQDENEPCKFMLYEAYESEEAAASHKNTAHYIKWRDTVALWMEKAREGIKYKVICPAETK